MTQQDDIELISKTVAVIRNNAQASVDTAFKERLSGGKGE